MLFSIASGKLLRLPEKTVISVCVFLLLSFEKSTKLGVAFFYKKSSGKNLYVFAASCARILVCVILSPKSFSKLPTKSSGGPLSMISRIFGDRPTDLSVDRLRHRESITYTMSHWRLSSQKAPNSQYAVSPGSAVVPCMEYKPTDLSGMSAICLRCTLMYSPL